MTLAAICILGMRMCDGTTEFCSQLGPLLHWYINKEQSMSHREQGFFGHEWGDLPMIFTSDEVTAENHWQMTSRENKKSLFMVTNVLSYFLYYFISWTHHSATNNHRSLISPLTLRTVISELTLWRHHRWSDVMHMRGTCIVTSYSSIVLAHANWRKGDLH